MVATAKKLDKRKIARILRRKERSVENDAVPLLEAPGWDAIKINRISWPDRQVLKNKGGRSFFIEFKRIDHKVGSRKGEEAQAITRRRLKKRGFNVYICKTLTDVKKVIEHELKLSNKENKI